jgi:adenosylcobalamin-dependent ribonucleoside-triphosphate reductase
MKILPGGRHLWATGVGKRQYLANCHLAGWGDATSKHFEFAFMRLMEGGGVGQNYSFSRYLSKYGAPKHWLKLHIVCDPEHKDYDKMVEADVLSKDFVSDWAGCYQIPDTREGWADALVDLIDTYFRPDTKHQDRVYDVSIVRPEGAKLHTFGGSASGPLPLAKMLHEVADVLNAAISPGRVTPLDAMEIDHSIGQCVVAGGVRRSARMSILPWDDEYIFEFINCKMDPSKHWTTNISVEINDEFLAALADETNPAHEHASAVHHAVVRGMLENGEPGYWNSTLSNVGEVDWIHGTNPCGEIPLNEWDVCNLGHVNLEAFVGDPDGLPVAHLLMTRMLIRATFGDFTDPKQAEVVARNRRIGVGHFGVQGFLVKNGIKYSEAPQSEFPLLLKGLASLVRKVADAYCHELRIPACIKTTTMAPTGSVAKMPGATEGGAPIYARWFNRRMRFSTVRPEEMVLVNDYRAKGYTIEVDKAAANTLIVVIPTIERLVAEVEAMGMPADMVESCDEISLTDMLEFQAMYQECWADNAVSFTVNFPEGKYNVAETAEILAYYLPVLKGTTLMPDGTREQAPYERLTKAEYLLAASLVAVGVGESYDEQCASGACPIR